jgi:hypothetical protein
MRPTTSGGRTSARADDFLRVVIIASLSFEPARSRAGGNPVIRV